MKLIKLETQQAIDSYVDYTANYPLCAFTPNKQQVELEAKLLKFCGYVLYDEETAIGTAYVSQIKHSGLINLEFFDIYEPFRNKNHTKKLFNFLRRRYASARGLSVLINADSVNRLLPCLTKNNFIDRNITLQYDDIDYKVFYMPINHNMRYYTLLNTYITYFKAICTTEEFDKKFIFYPNKRKDYDKD